MLLELISASLIRLPSIPAPLKRALVAEACGFTARQAKDEHIKMTVCNPLDVAVHGNEAAVRLQQVIIVHGQPMVVRTTVVLHRSRWAVSDFFIQR